MSFGLWPTHCGPYVLVCVGVVPSLVHSLSAATVRVPGNSAQLLTLDVSHLPKGAYFVTVPTEEGSLHARFVKE